MFLRNNRECCFLIVTALVLAYTPCSRGFDDGLLLRVVDAVTRGVQFFRSDYSHVNVDGLFGVRVGQGQLIKAIEECKDVDCSEDLYETLVGLQNKLNITTVNAMSYVEEVDKTYFERFRTTIDKPYLLPYTRVRFGTLRDVVVGHDTRYNEDIGDGCFSRIMGTYMEKNTHIPKCNITGPCWDMMTMYGTARYTLTHQLLYFIVMEHVDCFDAVEKWRRHTNVHQIETRLCKQILKQASNSVKDGNVGSSDRDLFLEQSLLCGSLGFEDFFNTDWMNMVLRWQTHEGCFRNEEMLFGEDVDLLNGESNPTSRRLLREQLMKDGCLSHMSGLGFGLLCTYLRYLVLYL